MSAAGLNAVRDHILSSPELAGRLAVIDDAAALCAAILDLASTIDAKVTPSDLDAALAEGQHRNLERWL